MCSHLLPQQQAGSIHTHAPTQTSLCVESVKRLYRFLSLLLNSDLNVFDLCLIVLECSHVSERDAEMSDGDRRSERQSVRGAVHQPVHPHHDSAQTGTHTVLRTRFTNAHKFAHCYFKQKDTCKCNSSYTHTLTHRVCAQTSRDHKPNQLLQTRACKMITVSSFLLVHCSVNM